MKTQLGLMSCSLGVILLAFGCSDSGAEAEPSASPKTTDSTTDANVEVDKSDNYAAKDHEHDYADIEHEHERPPVVEAEAVTFSDLCEISQLENGSTKIACSGSEDVIIPAAEAESCSVIDNENGTASITCGDGEPVLVISDPGYETRVTASDLASATLSFAVDLSTSPKALEFHSQCGGEDCEDSDDEIDFLLSANEQEIAESTAFPWMSRDFLCLGEGAEGEDVEFEVSVENDGWVDLINPAVRTVEPLVCPLPGRLRGHNEDLENGTAGFSFKAWGSVGDVVEDPDDSANHVIKLAAEGDCNDVEVTTLVSVPLEASAVSITFDYKGTRGAGANDDYGLLWARIDEGDEYPTWDSPFIADEPTGSFVQQRICLHDSYKGKVVRLELNATTVGIGGGSCASSRTIEYFLDNFSVQEDTSCNE